MTLKGLLERLQRIFNKSPMATPVISLGSPFMDVTIEGLVATFEPQGAGTNILAATDQSVWAFQGGDAGTKWQPVNWDGTQVPTMIIAEGVAWQLNNGGGAAPSWGQVTGSAPGAAGFLRDPSGQAWGLLPTNNGDSTFQFSYEPMPAPVSIPFDSLTVTQFVAALNGAGFTTSLLDPEYGGYPARGIVETEAPPSPTSITLTYPTSLFYKEMQTYGWALDEQASRINDAAAQMDMRSATDEWLDYWGGFFDVPRNPGETDAVYGPRIFWEIIQPSQNNIALEIIVKNALGYDVVITDAMDIQSTLPTDLQPKAHGRFVMDFTHDASMTTDEVTAATNAIMALVRKYKAAGYDFLQATTQGNVPVSDSVAVSESIGLQVGVQLADSPQPGALKAGAGWIAGTPGLVAGLNAAIQEQVCITIIRASDGSTQSVVLSGG